MKRRRWDSKTKTKIVLEGLSGRPVSDTIYMQYLKDNGIINNYSNPSNLLACPPIIGP